MPRHNVGYIKPPEPDFIKRMKEQIGWKEGPDVETKREQLSAATDDDYDDRGDELPTVVVLKKGDLTADEAQEEIEKQKKIEDDVPAGEGGRILFRKPTKRSSEEASSSTIGPKKTSDDKSKKSDSKDSKSSKDAKRPKQNKKLLSFNDEEDEDS
ncbi:Hypothetical predicted protein [Cloeon dipterum]|uniref:DUF4604 domain-containing protein n=1 Tax=Cloeon dipterum TaxID=197152 RepID=A0A8S1C819_9INSE|nr:Hypothetical predicted protein [Cloeon dipterum]